METIGWMGAFLFAVCGVPQAIQCAKEGHCHGLNWPFMLAWFGGEVLTIIYLWPKQDWILLSNYLANFASLLIMMRYKIWERK